jgi:DNA-binding protein HU-beta
MNRLLLCNAIAEKTGLPKADVEKMLEAYVQVVTQTLKAGGEVTIAGFGTFLAKERKGRALKNPRTREPIEVPSVRVAKFKAGSNLKKSVRI